MAYKTVEEKRRAEKKLVSYMIRLYCNKKHGMKGGELCSSCSELDAYAGKRSDNCPNMENKTFCSSCKTHCYKPEMREKIRAVMRFAGPRLVFRRPHLVFRHIVDTLKEKNKIL